MVNNSYYPVKGRHEMDLLNSVLPRKAIDPKSLFKIPKSKNTSISENEYAIIINGGANPAENYERYWQNCSAVYQTLVNSYGYDKGNIFVIMSDGTSSALDLRLNDGRYGNSPLDLDFDGIADVQYAATKSNITKVFDTLANRVTSDDNVFIFVTDHGDTNSVIWLWNNTKITKNEFAQEVNKISNAKTINVFMQQCYSGGYVDVLKGSNRVITTACSANEESWPLPNCAYDEFCYLWVSAVTGSTPDNQYSVNADYNNDYVISMEEAFRYADSMRTRPETPQYSSPTDPNVGAYLTLSGRFDMDLYIRDSINDDGNEPTNVKYMYNSPDIWIEELGGGSVDNPIGGRTYNVCVHIHNKRAVSSTGTEKLYLNWAKAGIDLPWPSGWDGEEDKDIGCDNPKKMSGNVGDSLCYSIPIILPYSSVVVKIPWTTPIAEDYNCGMFKDNAERWHFCLLARVHDSETIRYEDSDSCRIDTFVVRNNNVAWKNISVIDGSNNKAVVWLQNHLSTTQKFRLHFTAHPNSKNELLGQYAETYIRLSPNVYEEWNAGGRKGTGISEVGENRLRITENNATLKDISLPANAVGMLETEVNFFSDIVPECGEFTFDIGMYDEKGETLYGGEHYKVVRDPDREFEVKALEDQVVMQQTPVTFSAVNIGEPATYVWYNAAGDSIASGTTLSTTATQSQQYRLSVQATADGYKGYDTVSVVVRNGAITSLSPNPATNQVEVSYALSNQVQGGTVQIANTNGIVLLSTPFANTQTSTALNLQNLVAGQYSVRLVSATGEVLDSKTLIVQ